MEPKYDFFISHSSEDNEHARELKAILKKINRNWEIFLDCDLKKPPLQPEETWRGAMLDAAINSRYLIFLTSSVEYLKEGCGWVYKEISVFHDKKMTRIRDGREKFNVEYFGIFLCSVNFRSDLYDDKSHGTDYYSLFNERQHITLDEGESVRSAFDRIKEKVLHMTEKQDEYSPYILDLVEQRVKKNPDRFSMESIDDLLLPELYQGETQMEDAHPVGFEEFCKALKKNHAAILGEQGGCGKTTFMTRLFCHYLEQAKADKPDAMIPLFVDARDLKNQNRPILRYLAEKHFQKSVASEEANLDDPSKQFLRAFQNESDSPRYLLLIDGCNEIPGASMRKFHKELDEFGKDGMYSNVRLILSSRSIDEIRNDKIAMDVMHVAPLADKSVREYLCGKTNIPFLPAQATPDGKQFHHILKIPMFLRLYAESSLEGPVDSKGQLVQKYILRQEEKDQQSMETEQEMAFCTICLRHILPELAYRLVMGEQTHSRYSMTSDELKTIMREICEKLEAEETMDEYGDAYCELLDTYDISRRKPPQVKKDFVKYLTKTCKLLREVDEDRYEFVHQIYRDFFCGQYIERDIRRSLKNSTLCESLKTRDIEQSVGSFAAELLNEPKPFWNWDKNGTDYGEEGNSKLLAMLDNLRTSDDPDLALYTAGVIALLRIARNHDLSGINFSGLNLTRSDLRTCIFSKKSTKGWRAANFCGAVINPENLLTIQHNCSICAACANKNYLATLDVGGVIMLWDRSKPPMIPEKIIENAAYGFFKILFAPDGNSIYGVNDSRILRIPIPQSERGKAEPQLVLETNKRFWDIVLRNGGELYFTTAMNPYNPKPVSAPDCADQISTHFDARNSCASVNSAGTQLAYGFSMNKQSLRVYDYDQSENTWIKREIGYSLVSNRYTEEIEALLKEWGLYEAFVMDEDLSQMPDQRPRKLAELREMCRKGKTGSTMLGKSFQGYLSSILEALQEKKIDVSSAQRQAMYERCDVATERYLHMSQYAGAFFGRKNLQMRSVVYNDDDSRILIAYTELPDSTVNQKEKQSWVHVVSEMDLSTQDVYNYTRLRTKKMTYFNAQYVDGGILVTTHDRVTIFGLDGKETMQLVCNGAVDNYLERGGPKSGFFVFSEHNIYRLSKDGKCTLALNNALESKYLARIFWRGQDFLIDRAERNNGLHWCIDLRKHDMHKIGRHQWYSKDRYTFNGMTWLQLGKNTYHIQHGRLYRYFDGELRFEHDIPLRLFVRGCNFQKIEGNLAMPEYRQWLSDYGAITDPSPAHIHPRRRGIQSFTPSKDPFVEGARIDDPAVLFVEQDAENTNLFLDSDYSILEWTNWMKVTTPEIILRLMKAGCLVPSTEYEHSLPHISQRIEGYLCKKHILTKLREHTETQPYYKQSYGVSTTEGIYILWRGTDAEFVEPKAQPHPDEQELHRWLKTGNWFSQMAYRYAGRVTDHAFYSLFRSKYRLQAQAHLDACLVLGDQPFFAQPVLALDFPNTVQELRKKVASMCAVACGWQDLVRFGRCGIVHRMELSRVPVLVFIGNNLEHCKQIDAKIRDIDPRIRKLYTYDALLEDGYCGPVHFEFVNGQPYAVELEDLIHPDDSQ